MNPEEREFRDENCPVKKATGDHDWIKPHPTPKDHKYECNECSYYDLDDYE